MRPQAITAVAGLVELGKILGLASLLVVFGGGEAVADGWGVESGDDRHREITARYLQMLQEDPDDTRVLERLVDHVGRGQQLQRLIADYQERLEDNPEDADLHLLIAHLYRKSGEYEQAHHHYDRVIERQEQRAAGWIGRGRVRLLTGRRAQALEDFERGLQRESDRSRRRELTEELGRLAFTQREFERGKKYYQRLIDREPRNRGLRMDYIRLLVQFRQLDTAIEQYTATRPLVAADAREEANLLRDKAEVYQLKGDHQVALKTYEEALDRVRPDSWLADEIRDRVVEVYRQTGRLEQFLDDYANRWRGADAQRRMLVADVYAELGDLESALEIYRALADADPGAVEPRRRAVRLLRRLGDDDAVTEMLRQIVEASPRDRTVVFELAEHYVRRGQRRRAREVLDAAHRRFSGRPQLLAEIAGRYDRWGFDDRARRLYEGVLEQRTDDGELLVEIGDYFFERDRQRRALEIWAKLPDSRLGKHRGVRRHAEVLVERGFVERGIEVYGHLLDEKPGDDGVVHAMARALERADAHEEAIRRWHQFLEITDSHRRRARVRSRIVELHHESYDLRARLRSWLETAGQSDPPAVDPTLFAAEAHRQLEEVDAAEQLLEKLHKRKELSDDERIEVLWVLERLYVHARRYDEATVTAQRLLELSPKHREEVRQRQVEYALEAGDYSAAARYADALLEHRPNDARVHLTLGDIQRDAGNLDEALTHYQTAIAIDPREHRARYKFGKTLYASGDIADAEEALMIVVDEASKDPLVRDAGELMLEIAARHDRLDILEQRWSHLALRLPVDPEHVDLMFQLYNRLAGPLILEAYYGDADHRQRAISELKQLGGRATTFVVDQLRADYEAAGATLLRLVAEMDTASAAPQLAALIEQQDDDRLRHIAMVAAARIGDEVFVDPLERSLDAGSVATRRCAIWALGFVESHRATRLLVEVVEQESDAVNRALAAISLANQTMAPDAVARVDDVLEHRMEQLESGDWLDVVVYQTLAGDVVAPGERLNRLLQQLALSHTDAAGRMAARALGAFDDVDAVRRLWELALHEDPMVASHGEYGLLVALVPTGVERDWHRQMQYFDWERGQFDVVRLVRNDGRRGPGAPAVWSDLVERGLIQAVERDSVDLSDRLVDRIVAQFDDAAADRFWSQRRVRHVADILFDSHGAAVGGEPAGLFLRSLSGKGGEIDTDATELEMVLRAAALSGRLPAGVDPALLQRLLADGEVAVKRRTLETLAALEPDEQLREQLAGDIEVLLEHDEVSVQVAAVRAVAALQLRQLNPQLRRLESDAPPQLRRAIRRAGRMIDDS